ncbi:MAG: YidC/Oxa1 family membrane protein insertase [bacterium]
MYNTYIYQPILNLLVWLYQIGGNNLGLAIILLTLIIRTVMIPFVLPSLKSAAKMAKLKPKLDELKTKHGKDQKALSEAQLSLYKEHGINPTAGCLPYIVQFVFLIALYRVFANSLQNGNLNGQTVNTMFYWWDLKLKDTTYALPLLSGALQLLTSLAILPAVEDNPEGRKELKKEAKEDVAEMAQTMQQQMVFMMPIMTVVFALQFPSGLALYWVVTTAFSFVQQIIISGPGALGGYLKRLGIGR